MIEVGVGIMKNFNPDTAEWESNKMTRGDAIKKLDNQFWNSPESLLNTLEALGLIKFDEKIDKQELLKEAAQYTRNSAMIEVSFASTDKMVRLINRMVKELEK